MKVINLNQSVMARTAFLLICLLIYTLTGLAEDTEEFELMWGTFGVAGESGGGEYSQTGSVLITDGNEMSGGDFSITEESIASPECIVDFHDFVVFAEWWLVSDCNELNDWCGGADLYEDYIIDVLDLKLFVDEWLHYCPDDWQLK